MHRAVLLLALLLTPGLFLGNCKSRLSGQAQSSSKLTVTFFDVGQGDCTLVQTPDGASMLVDGGPPEAGKATVAYLRQHKVRTIDVVVATHPHADHIGGLIEVVKHVPVRTVLDPGYNLGTDLQIRFLQAVRDRRAMLKLARSGDSFLLGQKVRVEVLAPSLPLFEEGQTESPANNNSVVLKLTYGKARFLLTGDLEEAGRQRLYASGKHLSASVLKVAHHGSENGTDTRWLKAVRPQAAVISCGAENDYRHPHACVLQMLKRAHVTVFRTDKQGTVRMETDGQRLNIFTTR